MKRTLTHRMLKALKPKAQRYEIMDSLVRGMGIRVSEGGVRTFILITRFPGHRYPARRSLGEYPTVTLEQARDKARLWIELVHRGIDPATEEERLRLAEQRRRADTFGSIADDFIREKLPGERKGWEVAQDLQRVFIPILGNRPIVEITARDIVEIIKPVARRAPYAAHNCLGHVRRLYNWAIAQNIYGIETSPVDRLKPKMIIGKRESRTRILDDDELRALWQVAGELGYPYGEICRMLLWTGARHHEVSEAPWTELDLNKALWTISKERFKSELPHVVPLTQPVLNMLAAVPQFRSGNYVFTTTFGRLPTAITGKVKIRIDRRMAEILGRELPPWVVHDLRRTMRTHLSGLGIADHVAEMVIGHGRKGLQRIYDQHRYESEMRQALERWAGRLRSIVEPAPGKVVSLRA
jgi:integrase